MTARWGPDSLELDIRQTLNNLNLKNYHNIVLAGKKYKQYMGYDLIVDDNPNLANGMIGMKKPYLIVFDQPWNRSIECEKYPTFFRAKNWKQVYKFIRGVS